MHPFWDAFVKILPRWLAPNLMTFSGFLLLLLNFMLLCVFDWDFRVAFDEDPFLVPSWVWFTCGISHFLSHTLDGADGKQARRTGSSTPLGELMDHGCDSMAAWLMFLSLLSPLGVADNPWQLFWILNGVMLAFYCTHWEKYITGVLFLPWAYDLSQIIITVVFIVSGFYGTHLWTFRLDFLPYEPTIIQLFKITTAGGIALQQLQSLYNIYVSPIRRWGLRDSMTPLVALALHYASFAAWVLISRADVLHNHTRMLYTAMGLVFSAMTCGLIVSQMTGRKHNPFDLNDPSSWLLCVMPFVVFSLWAFRASPATEVAVLHGLVAGATVVWTLYFFGVVSDICKHLRIYLFSITSRPTSSKLAVSAKKRLVN
eukprot:Opistho-2@51744